MKKYSVIVTKIGSIELYADSPEEAMKIAEESDEEQIFWNGINAADAEEIEEND